MQLKAEVGKILLSKSVCSVALIQDRTAQVFKYKDLLDNMNTS